ncbi:MAG: SDR family oxidoreductase [Thermostichales cyanobacterium BF4_bins_65]
MDNRVVVVVGATGGIGQAVLPGLVQRGCRLALVSRSAEKLTSLAEAIGGETLVVPTDVTDYAQVEAMVQRVREHWGRIDVLIHAAGIGILKLAQQLSPQDLERLLAVNVKGNFYTNQLVGNVMREQKSGHILNFPGILGRYPMAMAAGYCASKFAVVGFSKCMADEWKRFGVRFTLFYLGGVNSPFWDQVNLKVQREKMISPTVVAEAVLLALTMPPEVVPAEINLQPENHQFI